jgi:hypothetical protein
VFLSSFDTIFLMLSILESVEKTFIVKLSPLHCFAVVHLFYPLRNINLCCCIYITVALAMERYLVAIFWNSISDHFLDENIGKMISQKLQTNSYISDNHGQN